MSRVGPWWDRDAFDEADAYEAGRGAPSPGKVALTARLAPPDAIVQRSAAPPRPTATPRRRSGTSAGLPDHVQHAFDAAFGVGLSDVQIHVDGEAEAMNARAFARGSHIHFAPGQYQPDTREGRELIGHELTHVLQQRAGRVHADQPRGWLASDTDLEREADDLGARAARGERVSVPGVSGAPIGTAVQRQVVQRQLTAEQRRLLANTPQAINGILEGAGQRPASGSGHPSGWASGPFRVPASEQRMLWSFYKAVNWRAADSRTAQAWGQSAMTALRAHIGSIESAVNAQGVVNLQGGGPERFDGAQFVSRVQARLQQILQQQSQTAGGGQGGAQGGDRATDAQPASQQPAQQPEGAQSPAALRAPDPAHPWTNDPNVVDNARSEIQITDRHTFTRRWLNPEIIALVNDRALRSRLTVFSNRLRSGAESQNDEQRRQLDQQITQLRTQVRQNLQAQLTAARTAQTQRTNQVGEIEDRIRPLLIRELQLEERLVEIHRARQLRGHENDGARLAQLQARRRELEANLTPAQRQVLSGFDELPAMPAESGSEGRGAYLRSLVAQRTTIHQQRTQLYSGRSRAGDRTDRQQLDRLRGQRTRGHSADELDSAINRLDREFVQSVEQTSIRGRVRRDAPNPITRSELSLSPVRNPTGGAVARPTGVQVGGNAQASDEIIDSEARRAFRDPQDIQRAIQILRALRYNEGGADGINTWDRLTLTVGAGLGGSTRQRNGEYQASGRLQHAFLELARTDPDAFYELFGRYGIAVTSGTNPELTVLVRNAEGGGGHRLRGMEALNHIVSDPVLLLQLRRAGHDPRWQRVLTRRTVEGTMTSQTGSRGPGSLHWRLRYESGHDVAWEDIVHGLPAGVITSSYAAITDYIHGYGNDRTLTEHLAPLYRQLAASHHFDPANPNAEGHSMPIAARREMVRHLMADGHLAEGGRSSRRRGWVRGIGGDQRGQQQLEGNLEGMGVAVPEGRAQRGSGSGVRPRR